MADLPLRTATDRCLGEQLPHQLANQMQAYLQAMGPKIPTFHYPTYVEQLYAVLIPFSRAYSPLEGKLPTRYSPVRQFNNTRRCVLPRLACVKHAASVRPEPG